MKNENENKNENFKQMINALERAAKDYELLCDKLMAEHDYRAEFPASDARYIRAAIELLKELEFSLVGLWNHGWCNGQADHAQHMRGREYSEVSRDEQIRKILEVKLP